MKHDDKVLFWQIVSNLFLVVFTFWMGLSVQSMIIDNASNYNEQRTKVEHILPIYKELTGNELINFIAVKIRIKQNGVENTLDSIVTQQIANDFLCLINSDELGIIESTRKAFKRMSDFRYYTSNKDDFARITQNSHRGLLWCKLWESLTLNGNLSEIDYAGEIEKYISSPDFRLYTSFWGNSNTKEISELSSEIIMMCKEYTAAPDVLKTVLALDITNLIIDNMVIIEEYLSPETSTYSIPILKDINIPKGATMILLFGIVIIVVIGLLIAWKISNNNEVASNIEKMQRKLNRAEVIPIITKDTLDRKDEHIRKLQQTIKEIERRLDESQQTISALTMENSTLKSSANNHCPEEPKNK